MKYAYARKVQVQGDPMYSLVLTDRPYSEDILKKGNDLSDAVGFKDNLHFLITTEGKIVTMNFYLSQNISTSKAYASANRKTVTIGADSIEGELAEEDSDFDVKWSYRVSFKSAILK